VSFQNTYAFNTSISFLIKLTNQLATHAPPVAPSGVTPPPKKKNSKHANISPELYRYSTESLVQMLSPLAPAFGEECWEALKSESASSAASVSAISSDDSVRPLTSSVSSSVFASSWPSYDEEAMKEDKVVCGIQVNGKSRFNIEFNVADLPQEKAAQEQYLKDLVYQHERADKWLKDDQGSVKAVKKMIVVKGGKIVNFVL